MNELNKEDSLYLQQHAKNPVNWHAWSQKSIEDAKKFQKPIILSIGYSACHWCHVMAHESFEDEETALIMNENFFNIKVDKEERPDLDNIYQTSHQIINGSAGGWPLTVFLDPKTLLPFFSGTYFPKENKYGQRAFKDVLNILSSAFRKNKKEIELQTTNLSTLLNQELYKEFEHEMNLEPLEKGVTLLEQNYDRKHGGFGSAPKFPQCSSLMLLNQINHEKDSKSKLGLIDHTVNRMVHGGIRDHLEGGFFRYSVDEKWMIPHFEKMLYDNAQILSVLIESWKRTNKKLFLDVARETADWVLKEMSSKEGGFYSTIDADSEGEEGKFYSWTLEELEEIIEVKDREFFYQIYGLNLPSNFEDKYHLHCNETFYYYKDKFKDRNFEKDLSEIKDKLLTRRKKRVHPNKDKKILVSWNALCVEGLSCLFDSTENKDYLNAAEKCLRFIKDRCYTDGRLYSCFNNGSPQFGPFLNDYSFLCQAIFSFLKIKWSDEYLEFGLILLEEMRKTFIDDQGKTFMTANNPELIYRPKHLYDESVPSGNAYASFAFRNFGHLLGKPEFISIADQIIKDSYQHLQKTPEAMPSMLLALNNFYNPPKFTIICGTTILGKSWVKKIKDDSNKIDQVFFVPFNAKIKPDYLREIKSKNEIFGIVCNENSCSKVFENLEELIDFKRSN